MSTLTHILIKPVIAARPVAPGDFLGDLGASLPSGIPQELSQTTTYLSGIIRFIVMLAGLFTLWQFLTGGLGMITSGGDKGKLTEAQHKITSALTGIIIITASFLIIGIISQLLFGSFTAILVPTLETVSP